MMNKNLLSQCFIQEGKFKPKILGEKVELTIRQLTIAETQEFKEILKDENKTQKDAVYYAVKCAMVEPPFFSDEELKKLNVVGENLIFEVYGELPLIGKNKKERETYQKQIQELVQEASPEAVSEEEEEKK